MNDNGYIKAQIQRDKAEPPCDESIIACSECGCPIELGELCVIQEDKYVCDQCVAYFDDYKNSQLEILL